MKLSDFNAFGFDVDHTLAVYNIPNLFEVCISIINCVGRWRNRSHSDYAVDKVDSKLPLEIHAPMEILVLRIRSHYSKSD